MSHLLAQHCSDEDEPNVFSVKQTKRFMAAIGIIIVAEKMQDGKIGLLHEFSFQRGFCFCQLDPIVQVVDFPLAHDDRILKRCVSVRPNICFSLWKA